MQQQKDFSSETDADPVFSLDDFTDDCEPFFESEEDDLSSGEKSKFILYDMVKFYSWLSVKHSLFWASSTVISSDKLSMFVSDKFSVLLFNYINISR